MLTTHYLEEAGELADRLAIMHQGRIVRTGTPAQVAASQPARISFELPQDSREPVPGLAGTRASVTAHARLSVAEERLRFARDLHDVLGRNLSLIAVQSELAAELARRGDQDAAGQMLQVRQVAHESLREMRAVVSGYRAADLGTELAGAQDVLRSAGVSCRVTGDAAGLPADVQAALGWVVREGTTNIIRHSDATAATIELHIPDSPGAPRAVTLSMDNDRVHTPDAGSGGNGLAGLGERLAGLGGSITTGHPRNGHFRLEASLPACGAAAVPPGPGQRGPQR